MEIVPVSTILNTKRFSEPVLNALVPNVDNYKVLLMQPPGDIEAHAGVRNHNHSLALKQFSSFLMYAKETDADLVVTPEYAMPWESLIESIEKGNVPTQGKIWALGCESITYNNLKKLKRRLSSSVEMLFEELQAEPGQFVSPLAYVFLAADKVGKNVPKTVILVQFKTHPMSDKDHFEVTGMQRGSIIYEFGSCGKTVRLISLICSDVFAFEDAHGKAIYDRALVLHIQLNPNPRHEQFQRCREQLLSYQNDETEILCLNWANNVQQYCAGDVTCWNNISGSAWYIKSSEFDDCDNTLRSNHRQGLYYTWLKPLRTHALFFNFTPAIFLLEATKVAHIGVHGAGPKRRGPQLIKRYSWDDTINNWNEDMAQDAFCNVAGESGAAEEELIKIADRNPLEVERFLALSSGNIERCEDWHKPKLLDSCVIESSEIIRRITFAQDIDPQAKAFRTARLKRCGHLWNILSDVDRLPPELADFKGGFSFGWSDQYSLRISLNSAACSE